MTGRNTPFIGILGGIVHIIAIGIPYLYFFGLQLISFDNLYTSLMSIYVIVGVFLLGAVPAALLSYNKLVSPSLIIGFFSVTIFIFSWNGENNAQLAGPSNIDFYFMFWFVPLLIALIIGGVEYGLRKLITSEDETYARLLSL